MDTITRTVTQTVTSVESIKNTEELLSLLEGTAFTGFINAEPHATLRGIVHPKGRMPNDAGRRLLSNDDLIVVSEGRLRVQKK